MSREGSADPLPPRRRPSASTRSAPRDRATGAIVWSLAVGLLLLAGGPHLVGCVRPPATRDNGAAAEVPEPLDDRAGEDPAARFWRVFRAASSARREGDSERAMSLYTEALTIDPDHGDSHYYLSQFHAARGEVGAAVEHLSRLTRLEPASLRGWQQLSLLQSDPRPGWGPDPEAAALAARRATELNRDESFSHLLLGRALGFAGARVAARIAVDEALGHNPGLGEALALRAWLDATAEARAADLEPWLAPIERPNPVDLDNDGEADIVVFETAGTVGFETAGTVAAVGRANGLDGDLLPATGRVLAWERRERPSGPWPVPWSAAILRDPAGERLVVLGGGTDGARLYRRQGDVFVESPGLLPALSGPPVLAVADFDGDGLADLVFGNIELPQGATDGERVGARLMRGTAVGGFTAGGFEIRGLIQAAVALDLEGDGDMDLVAATGGPRTTSGPSTPASDVEFTATTELRVWRNVSGRLEPGGRFGIVGGVAVRGLVAADVNGDGYVDLYAVAGSASPEAFAEDGLWLGTVTGLVDATPRLGPPGGPTAWAWPLERGLLLARGGLVPGSPRRYEIFDLR